MSEERWADGALDALLERSIGALDEHLGSVIDFQAVRDDFNARLDAIAAPDVAQPAEPTQVPPGPGAHLILSPPDEGGVIPLSLEALRALDPSPDIADKGIERDGSANGIGGFGI